MTKKRIKKKEHENLTPANIEKVKALLNPCPSSVENKPITKREACNILNIAYNTNRLSKIIEEHDEQKAYTKKRKAGLRGRPASNAEISEAVTSFLEGDTFTDISKRLFRSVGFVRAILEKVGVPERPSNKEERKVHHYFPDECVSMDFEPGEIAWSSIYHSTVTVTKQLNNIDYESTYGCPCYSVYVTQKLDDEDELFSRTGGFYAYTPAYELGKLEHLTKYGVVLERL
jgi:hypothetical protein